MSTTKKLLAVAAIAVGATLSTTAPAHAVEYYPPSLNYQGCPGGVFERTAGDGTRFKYELDYKYTPNGGLVWIGRYANWYMNPAGVWRYNGRWEYYC